VALDKQRKYPPAKPATVKFEVPAELWAVGDSWLDDILGGYPDLITALRPLGYDVTNEALDHTHSGLRLGQLAADAFLAKLRRDLADAVRGIGGPALPKAILLCGGGNDLVQPKDRPHRTPLYGMLRAGAKDAVAAIDRPALDAYLERMRGYHERVLDVLTGAKVPILIHAYDHPIPDGRDPTGTGGWLKPIFDDRRIDPDTAKAVMRTLIDGLNTMVADLVAHRPPEHNVHHLALAGTLEKAPDFAVSHEIYWGDELHPTPEGYHVIAKVVAQRLAERGVAPVKKP
jgi:lysophospholipase L1-like esterase